MTRDTKSRITNRLRKLILETLEVRQLLAVDGIRIDLTGNGANDLFGPDGGGSLQQGYADRPIR